MLTVQALNNLGVNTADGLSRCLNNEQFYFRLINTAMEDDSIEQLETAIGIGDLDTAFQIAHNLKGSMGNLSLTPIYEPIAEMTELLRSRTQTDYTAYLSTIKEKYKLLRDLCKK